MAEQLINLDAMQDIVDRLDRACAAAPGAAARLYDYLDEVNLSADRLSGWRENGQRLWQLRRLAQECRQRLELARQIAASNPGMSLRRMVPVDESVFVNNEARRAAELIQRYIDNSMGGGGGAIPKELLALLDANSQDIGFAVALQTRLGAGPLARLLLGLNARRNDLSVNVGLGAAEQSALDGFDTDYAHLLDGLGATLSLAARGMSPDRLAVFTGQWQAVIQDSAATPSAALLSLVIARGSWPDEFLSGVATTILYDDEKPDAAAWQTPGGTPVVDPHFNPDLGCKPQVVDPLAGVFQSAADYSPEWMLRFFQGNGTTPVELPGYDFPDGQHVDPKIVQNDSRIDYLMTVHGLDQSSGYWFGQAAQTAAVWDLRYGEQNGRFARDVADEVEYFARQQVVYDHLSWWDKNKHEFLQIMGGVLMVASLVATAAAAPVAMALLGAADAAVGVTDSVIYLSEGEILQGLLGLVVSLVPVAISVGGVVRWVRLSRAEVEIIETTGEVVHDGAVVTKADLDASLPPATTEASIERKLDAYLLDESHPEGGPKAKWFRQALGFTRTNMDQLARQLVFDETSATAAGVTEHGVKYNQVITITGANGKIIDVEFIWIRNHDGVVRLVTAIPTDR